MLPCHLWEIDWIRDYEFLDKELQRVVRDAELEGHLVYKKDTSQHTNSGWKYVNTRDFHSYQVLEVFRCMYNVTDLARAINPLNSARFHRL